MLLSLSMILINSKDQPKTMAPTIVIPDCASSTAPFFHLTKVIALHLQNYCFEKHL